MPDRFASIHTLLPTRPAAESVRGQPADEPPNHASEGSYRSSTRPELARGSPPRRTADQPAARASDSADGGNRRIAFRLDPGLHHQLSERATTTKASKGNVVLDATEDAHAVGALTYQEPQPTRTGMFARTADRGPAAPTVLVEIRLTSQAVRTLDQLVERTKQPTRTQLLHAALSTISDRPPKATTGNRSGGPGLAWPRPAQRVTR